MILKGRVSNLIVVYRIMRHDFRDKNDAHSTVVDGIFWYSGYVIQPSKSLPAQCVRNSRHPNAN